MNSGRIEQIDTPHEIYTAPASRWVAQFVGEASLVSGTATGWQVTTALGDLALESPHDGAVDVLVRPEQLSIGQTGESAIVDSVEFYGHDAMVNVRLEGQRVRVRTAPEVKVRRGDEVNVTFAGHSVRAFPAD